MTNDLPDRRGASRARQQQAAGAGVAASRGGVSTPAGGDQISRAELAASDLAPVSDPVPSSAAASSSRAHGLKDSVEDKFARLAERTSVLAGSFWTFATALLVVLVWAATGPFFGYSETWQLVINTGTTIITFLMVFVIQHAQNKEMRAIQLKLNEIIAAIGGASNRMIDIEDLSERELERLYVHYQHMAVRAKKLASDVAASEQEAAPATPNASKP